MIPSVEMAQELHKKYAPSQAAYDLIHTHCVIVATIGKELAQRANARYQAAQMRGASVQVARAQEHPQAQSGAVGEQVWQSGDSLEAAIPQRELDVDLVYLGGLLHDIGTYKILASDGAEGRPLAFDDHYIQHGLAGYELLKAEGVDESVAQFARNHTGVGLTRAQVEAEHLDLPVDDYLPRSLEQELVMYADNYHSKHQPPIFVSEPTAAKRTAKFGEENLRRWKMLVAKYGVPDLKPLAEQYGMEII
ncbi:phosphohydrolase [Bombiscardovia nodaiensis]|uniref:Phosphohydrolase n=1 Tax=Bombiscardovia nodaiensis TaxID=2932181 RepID=A0ABM8B6K9_9BIFI|nr:phosphohydrolase [Bombiscardovia nodaiensis]